MLFLLILIALIVCADQLTKWLAVVFLQNGTDVSVIPGILRFIYVENDGAAFGMLDEHRWVFMVLSSVAIVVLLIFLWRKPPKSLLCRISIAFLIGGGIGNMIDRSLLGYVIDFIDFCAFPTLWKWVFNVADAFVTVGTGMMVFYLIRELVRDFRREKQAKASLPPETDDGEARESWEGDGDRSATDTNGTDHADHVSGADAAEHNGMEGDNDAPDEQPVRESDRSDA